MICQACPTHQRARAGQLGAESCAQRRLSAQQEERTSASPPFDALAPAPSGPEHDDAISCECRKLRLSSCRRPPHRILLVLLLITAAPGPHLLSDVWTWGTLPSREQEDEEHSSSKKQRILVHSAQVLQRSPAQRSRSPPNRSRARLLIRKGTVSLREGNAGQPGVPQASSMSCSKSVRSRNRKAPRSVPSRASSRSTCMPHRQGTIPPRTRAAGTHCGGPDARAAAVRRATAAHLPPPRLSVGQGTTGYHPDGHRPRQLVRAAPAHLEALHLKLHARHAVAPAVGGTQAWSRSESTLRPHRSGRPQGAAALPAAPTTARLTACSSSAGRRPPRPCRRPRPPPAPPPPSRPTFVPVRMHEIPNTRLAAARRVRRPVPSRRTRTHLRLDVVDGLHGVEQVVHLRGRKRAGSASRGDRLPA